MKRLFFEINGQFRKYTVAEYLLENDFYVFTDTLDRTTRKLHSSYYRGEEEVKP